MRLDSPWLTSPGGFCAGMCAQREQWGAALAICGVLVAMVFAERLSRQIEAKRAELARRLAKEAR